MVLATKLLKDRYLKGCALFYICFYKLTKWFEIFHIFFPKKYFLNANHPNYIEDIFCKKGLCTMNLSSCQYPLINYFI